MNTPSHILIYSHGFGVRKDDRGLFTDIAAALPNVESIMFDYNEVDEAANTLTVAPLDTQAERLRAVIADAKAKHSNAVIDLICHSQGCVTAALACPKGVRQTILTAPPPRFSDTETAVKRYSKRYGVAFTKEKVARLPRQDGSTTIIPPEYWRIRDGLDVQTMYNTLAAQTNLTIITATEDEILGEVNFNKLSPKVNVVEMKTGHNFEGSARLKLNHEIAKLIGETL